MDNGTAICEFVHCTLLLSDVCRYVTLRTERIADLLVLLLLLAFFPNKIWAIMTCPDTGRSGARIPERPRDFSFFQNVHIGPWAIPASRLVDTWRLFCYIQVLRNRSYMYFGVQVLCNVVYKEVLACARHILSYVNSTLTL